MARALKEQFGDAAIKALGIRALVVADTLLRLLRN